MFSTIEGLSVYTPPSVDPRRVLLVRERIEIVTCFAFDTFYHVDVVEELSHILEDDAGLFVGLGEAEGVNGVAELGW
jgi:hypothetical protein